MQTLRGSFPEYEVVLVQVYDVSSQPNRVMRMCLAFKFRRYRINRWGRTGRDQRPSSDVVIVRLRKRVCLIRFDRGSETRSWVTRSLLDISGGTNPENLPFDTWISVLAFRTTITLSSTPAAGYYDERRGECKTGQRRPEMVRSRDVEPFQAPTS